MTATSSERAARRTLGGVWRERSGWTVLVTKEPVILAEVQAEHMWRQLRMHIAPAAAVGGSDIAVREPKKTRSKTLRAQEFSAHRCLLLVFFACQRSGSIQQCGSLVPVPAGADADHPWTGNMRKIGAPVSINGAAGVTVSPLQASALDYRICCVSSLRPDCGCWCFVWQVRHPFGHGGFTRAHVTAELQRYGDTLGEKNSAVAAAHARYARNLSASNFSDWPVHDRRVFLHAAAWEHGLQELRRQHADDRIFRLLLRSRQFHSEARRRAHQNLHELGRLIPDDSIVKEEHDGDSDYMVKGCIHDNGGMRCGLSESGEKDEHGEAHNITLKEKGRDAGQGSRGANDATLFGDRVYLLKYSEGLYYNISGGKWYDTRIPRSKDKEAYPQPPPSSVLNLRQE